MCFYSLKRILTDVFHHKTRQNSAIFDHFLSSRQILTSHVTVLAPFFKFSRQKS